MEYNFFMPNKCIELSDFNKLEFKIVLDDMHAFLNVPQYKRDNLERCRGNSILEPAVFESYKHWDNPWAILNANLSGNMKVLDCGAGRGVLQFYLSKKGMEIHSIDISNNRSKIFKKTRGALNKIGIKYTINPDIVHKRLNKKYGTSVEFSQQSADALFFPANYFDRIFCISVIEHMDDNTIAKSIKEMERVLKKGGLLLLTFDFHPLSDKSIIGFTEKDFINKILRKCNLKIVNGKPNFRFSNWNVYIKEINTFFRTNNPNTSFGVVLTK